MPDSAWQRRSSKQLVKILAVTPDHRLHRERIQDILWPDSSPESASGAFRKALHHARRALEPDLPPRGTSAHLLLRDDLVSLNPASVWIDADAFQAQAEAALGNGEQKQFEAAMACLPLGEWQRGIQFERRFGELSDTIQFVRDSADVHLCLSEYHVYSDQPTEAAQEFLRALTEAERVGATRTLALCQYYLGNMAYFRGRFAEALARLSESISKYRQIQSSSGEAIATMMRGVTLTALGRINEARTSMENGLELAESSTLRSHASIRLLAGLGRNRIDANDAAGARTYAERALALAEEPSDCICYAAVYPMASAALALPEIFRGHQIWAIER